MLGEYFIKPAQIEWAAPIVFDPSKGETLQFCIHYRKRIPVIKQDSSQIPRMDKCIDPLSKATVFSTLNNNKVYLQTELIMQIKIGRQLNPVMVSIALHVCHLDSTTRPTLSNVSRTDSLQCTKQNFFSSFK